MNLSHEVNEAIERVIGEHSHPDEHVGYVAGLTVANNEAGLPTAITAIALRMNAATPGEYITQTFFVDTPIPAYEEIRTAIAELLMRMREARIAHMRAVLQRFEGTKETPAESALDGHSH